MRIGRRLPVESRVRVEEVEDIPVGQVSRVALNHCHARCYGYGVLRADRASWPLHWPAGLVELSM